jgi:ABC-2 type transport system ATP-binding protein
VIGPSGAGKSTLVKLIGGAMPRSAGVVAFDGHDVHAEYASMRSRIGVVPQDDVVHRQLTVEQALSYAAELRLPPDTSTDDRRQVVERVLDELELTPHKKTRVDKLSGGQRKRASVAMELLTGPSLLILDEPTSGLDPQATQEFLALIGELKAEGVTVLLSSHLLDQVQRMCSRVALFQAGRIVLMGPVADLARQVLGAGFVVEVEADGAGLARRLATVPGVTNVETLADDRFRMTADRDVRPDAARAVVAANGSLRRLSVDEPSLEAIYARYFQTHREPSRGARHAA